MIGQSFAPLGSDDPTKVNQQPGQPNGVQEAIKLLSLRIPRAMSGGSPIPQGLMGGPGGGTLPDIIRQILTGMGGGAGGPAAPMGMPGAGPGAIGGGLSNLPMPNVIPGIGEGEPTPGSFHPGGFDEDPPPAPAPAPTLGAGRRPLPMPGGRRPPTY